MFHELILLLPLVAAIYIGLQSATVSVKTAQIVTTGAVAIAALLSWITFVDVVVNKEVVQLTLFRWLDVGEFQANWSMQIDVLSSVMLVLVTTVSGLVHLYSVGYMSHDPHPQRFMAYLSLFTFFMLMLVTADNLIQLFLGWEGVGLASYLLIGFWYQKDAANAAAIKAFVVNRVGDFGLALGIFACFVVFGSVEYDAMFAQLDVHKETVITLFGFELHALTTIGVLLFIGAMGKSAQFILHTWLPDAMEGPTPVSALIHAATMVTAGVFLLARMSPLYELAPIASMLVTAIGALTALFAATVALTQTDIKRVIAYSTCSQLGYMFFACGVSAYGAAVFHLLTHGFFKALLFLGAGSVIHAMSNEQDMRHMGGIWKEIPWTYGYMIVGTLAITGFPLLSGYYSKEAILGSAFAAGQHGFYVGELAFWVGMATALLTAFYSWRLIFMTFHGECRAPAKVQSHIHESPLVMTLPLAVLAMGAVLAGYLLYQGGIVSSGANAAFWNGAVQSSSSVLEDSHDVPSWVVVLSKVTALLAFVLAFVLYIRFPQWPGILSRVFKPLYQFSLNKWYIDELYDCLFVRPVNWLGRVFWKAGDEAGIDRLGPNGVAFVTASVSRVVSFIQTGFVYHYALVMLLAMVGLISWFVLGITW